MKIRKHFRTSIPTIDYIIMDFSMNRISNKEVYLRYCVNNRLNMLNKQYDEKLDKILTFIISRCSYDNMPIDIISKCIMSLSKVTNALSKGFISLLSN